MCKYLVQDSGSIGTASNPKGIPAYNDHYLKKKSSKILFFSGALFLLLFSCTPTKYVGTNEYLLTENHIQVDSTEVKTSRLKNLLYQQPNTALLGIPLRLHIYNTSAPNPDSTYQAWLDRKPRRRKKMNTIFSAKQVENIGRIKSNINNAVRSAGEAPVIFDPDKTRKSKERLRSYFWNNGWFNAIATYDTIQPRAKEVELHYTIKRNQRYLLDSLHTRIDSPTIDSLYTQYQSSSYLRRNKPYKTLDLNAERDRLTSVFRNNGVYFFEPDVIGFDVDTVGTGHKVHIGTFINNRSTTQGERTIEKPFQLHRISTIHIYTDYSYGNRDKVPQDTVHYKDYTLFSYDKLRYRPKALTDAVLLHEGDLYRDRDRTTTYNQINDLRVFKYPNIDYQLDPEDQDQTDLITTIRLTPRKKYSIGANFDVSTSPIQTFGLGFGGSLLIRNVFKGAEIFEISGRSSIGASRDVSVEEDAFFDISEIGADLKLSFPRILLPFDTSSIIPKYMSPQTAVTVGLNLQQNIGLDKQNVTGVFNYIWTPNRQITHQLDIFNMQYVRNLNPNNYFRIYRSSFDRLQTIFEKTTSDESIAPEEISRIDQFITDVGENNFPELSSTDQIEIRNIEERRERLTEDNLIFTSSYTWLKNTRKGLYDLEFSRFRIKGELAGNMLSVFARASDLERDENGRFQLFGVEFSQYFKTEMDMIKHWDLGRKNILAFRVFGGIAIPYGNANTIPFSRSFFAGGANDNRAWLAYDLGPGSTGGRNEFNEANMKIAFNTEYRFPILGGFQGALFVDIGNIWNVLDRFENEKDATFEGFEDLRELAIGSGLGIRYDFDFFVLRLDTGFKTFNPARDIERPWFGGFTLDQAVFNVGINYPF